MTQKYNNVKNKEASLINKKMRIEKEINELDKRNFLVENNIQFIKDTKNELHYQILKNANEEKRIIDEKNNLKLRLDMIDSLRMKYLVDLTNSPFELMPKTFNKNNNINDFHLNLSNNIKNNKSPNEIKYSTFNQNNYYKTNNNILDKKEENENIINTNNNIINNK